MRDDMNEPEYQSTTGRLAAFRAGFSAPWHGFVFMCRRPGLWRYGVAPVLLNIVITGLMLVLLVFAVIRATSSLDSWFGENGYAIYWEVLAVCGLIVLMLGLVLATWKLLEGILCGHYYGKLAREVEIQIGTPPGELKEIPFSYQVADSVGDFVALVVINLGLLTLNCIPAVGSIAAVCGALYFNSLILGRDFLAFPTGLRGMRRSENRAFSRRFRFQTLGLGVAVLLFSLIPLVGAVLLTTATTGTVLLHQRMAPGRPEQAIRPTVEDLNT
jgi:uncharacterized protein involved in cysteine biosynthesis